VSTTKAIIITLIIALLLSFAYVLPAQGEENTDITIYTQDIDQNGVLLNWFMLLSDIPSTDTASVRENYGIPDTVSDALLFAFQAYITNHTSTTQHIAVLGIPYLYTVDEQGNKHIWRFFGEYDSLATADTVPEAILNKASLGSLAYGQGRIFWEYYLPAGETRSLIFLGWNKEMDDIYKQALAAVGGDRQKVNIGAYIWVWPWRGNPTGDLYHYNDYVAFYDLTNLMFYYDYQPEPPNNWPNTGTCDENFVYWKKEGDKYILAGHITPSAPDGAYLQSGVIVLKDAGRYYFGTYDQRGYLNSLQPIQPSAEGYFSTSLYTFAFLGEYTEICGMKKALALEGPFPLAVGIYGTGYITNRQGKDLGEREFVIFATKDKKKNTTWHTLDKTLSVTRYFYWNSYHGKGYIWKIRDNETGKTYDLMQPTHVSGRTYGNAFISGYYDPDGMLEKIKSLAGPGSINMKYEDSFQKYDGFGYTYYYGIDGNFVYWGRYRPGAEFETNAQILRVLFFFPSLSNVSNRVFQEFLAPVYNSSLPSLTASTDLISAIFSCKQPTGSYSGWFGWAQWIGDWFVYLVCLLWSLIKGLVFVIAAFLGFLVVIVGGVLMLIFYLLQMFAGIVTQVGQAFQEMNYPWNIVIAEVLLMGTYGLVMHTYDMIPMLNRR